MARVEIRPSGGHSYAVVVEDVQDGSVWRKRVMKSFGNAADPAKVQEAHKFAQAVNAGEYLRGLGMTRKQLQVLLVGLVGVALTAIVLASLFDGD